MNCICEKAFFQALLYAAILVASCFPAFGQQPTVSRAGGQVALYKASYALVIGAADYKFWPPLPNVNIEIEQVTAALKKQGFEVRQVMNPPGERLQSAFRDFFADYGNDRDNRLLVFFAGHGHSIDANGYLVPVDAPDPNGDLSTFLRRAQSMSQLASASKEFRARHALYVFDSCFSGAIFSDRAFTRNSAVIQEDLSIYLTGQASQPVRQFITSGSATQRVPEISQFTPLFLRAIEGEVPSLNKNGFVSAKDLGLWLQRNLGSYTSNQTPQTGTLLDARFERGDFVFGTQVSAGPFREIEVRPAEPKPNPLPRAGCFTFNGKQFCE